MSMALKSPINRMGGKYFLKDWLIQHIPQHTLYCEVFGGAGHVLFSKSPSRVEVLNDVDGHLINFFCVLQHPEKRGKLVEVLQHMPYSRQLWQEMRDRIRGRDVATVNISVKKGRGKGQKYQKIVSMLRESPELSDRQIARELGVSNKTVSVIRKTNYTANYTANSAVDSAVDFKTTQLNDIERAAEWYYLNRTCFGGDMQSGGFALPSVTGRNPAQSFRNSIDTFHDVARRMQGVTIECLDYRECIQRYDSPDTLFFIDPPYLNAEGYYGEKNFSLDDHQALAKMLSMVKGVVMVTHYQNGLYDELYKGWHKYEFQSFKGSSKADAGQEKPRTIEVLYTNFEPKFKTRSLFNGL
ncbi:MAG: DNA adenine methylase [Candidatus Jettenia sp.]|nr:MAG: DNA adenine methylase [Candidatus Jettenia sp.]